MSKGLEITAPRRLDGRRNTLFWVSVYVRFSCYFSKGAFCFSTSLEAPCRRFSILAVAKLKQVWCY